MLIGGASFAIKQGLNIGFDGYIDLAADNSPSGCSAYPLRDFRRSGLVYITNGHIAAFGGEAFDQCFA